MVELIGRISAHSYIVMGISSNSSQMCVFSYRNLVVLSVDFSWIIVFS